MDADYEDEERRQYEYITKVITLYGSTSKSANILSTVIEITDSVLSDMEELHPPLYRLPAHITFVRALRSCRRALGIAQAVGGARAGDEAIGTCANALLR